MTDEQAIKRTIIGLAEAFGVALSEFRLKLYAEALACMSASEVEAAIRLILKDPELKFFPLPAVILEKVRPTLSIDTATQELLQRCISAVSQFGYMSAKQAHEYVGDIAWEALGGQSGWTQFCCAGDFESGGSEIGTARAQLRGVLKAKLTQKFPEGRIRNLTELLGANHVPDLPGKRDSSEWRLKYLTGGVGKRVE